MFISYHHALDLEYFNEFSRFFSKEYEAVRDNSVDRRIQSTRSDYVIRQIREQYITGTSCTIVLCGPLTPTRKFIDWEIKATLDKEHGLIGVNLPNNPKSLAPLRLLENWASGYASWIEWSQLSGGVAFLRAEIEQAHARPKSTIRNALALKTRNG